MTSTENQVAVVTGGADGIGLAAARRFQQTGATVVVGDISEDKLKTAVADNMTGVVCDVRNDADIAQLATTAEALGTVDMVMANAGIAVGGRFDSIPLDEWQRLYNVNVMGVVRTINTFLPGMLERNSGHIIITGSSAGLFIGDGFNTPYASSKLAIRGIAEGLAVYTRETGISIHYLAPRLTDTAFPRSSVAWGRKGSKVTSDRELGDDFDTVDQVADALLEGIADNRFLISLTPDTEERMASYVI